LDAENIEKSSIYIHVAAAAGISSNYLRKRWRLSRSAYTSRHRAKPFSIGKSSLLV
jgi:hypothetical protein